MSNELTRRLLKEYDEQAPTSGFLSSFFQSPPENFHETSDVEIDIIRGGEEVAIVITDLSQSARQNSVDDFTNKKFTPPIYSEEFPINASDLIKREPGRNPFEDPIFQANAMKRFLRGMRKIDDKITRSIELQASQVLQTGILNLGDSSGSILYNLDFKPKSSHFPTVSNDWNGGSANIITDVISICNTIRNDGKKAPTMAIFGEDAIEDFVTNSDVKTRFDTRRIDLGGIRQLSMIDNGGQFRGTFNAGNFSLEIWSYPGRFTDPNGGATVQYVTPDKVIFLAETARLDAAFGAIPLFDVPNQNVLPFLPPEFRTSGAGAKLSTFAWVSPNGRQLTGWAGSRPLMIPTAIDCFGCLDTRA